MPLDAGTIFAASAVASSMLCSCSSPSCGEPGFELIEGSETITGVSVSDVACIDVTPSCLDDDDAGACATYYVLPVATGNCHVDVDLASGTTFATDVKIVRGAGGCAGFYPSLASDAVIEAP